MRRRAVSSPVENVVVLGKNYLVSNRLRVKIILPPQNTEFWIRELDKKSLAVMSGFLIGSR